jgi:anaerobic selenocysteine-containing dehydrogenase
LEKVKVITINGEVLIGVVVEPNNTSNNPFVNMTNGIWLQREKTISFIGEELIELIQPASKFDKEITV